jgi:hypothetical protein
LRSVVERRGYEAWLRNVVAGACLNGVVETRHDADLHLRVGIDDADRLGKALQAIDGGQQNVLDTPISELSQHAQPELRALALADPQPEQVLPALHVDRERHVDGARLHLAVASDLDV